MKIYVSLLIIALEDVTLSDSMKACAVVEALDKAHRYSLLFFVCLNLIFILKFFLLLHSKQRCLSSLFQGPPPPLSTTSPPIHSSSTVSFQIQEGTL